MKKRILFVAGALIAVFTLINAKTILFIGDSITDGNWGSPSKYPCSSQERNLHDRNHILGHGYVEMTAGYFMGEFPNGNFNFINRGISGETLHQIAERWENDVFAHKPDVISLLCGTNDIHYWLEGNPSSIEEFDFVSYKNTLASLISTTKTHLPETEFIICTPFVGKAGWAGNASNYDLRKQAVDSIAEITREVINQHDGEKIYLVDFNKLKDSLEEENNNTEYWIWDGIHPTTAMHHRMSKYWIEAIQPIIK